MTIALLLTRRTEESLSSKATEFPFLCSDWIKLWFFFIITYFVYFPKQPHMYTHGMVHLRPTSKRLDWTSKENSRKGSIYHQIMHRVTISLLTGWPSFLADMTLLRDTRTTWTALEWFLNKALSRHTARVHPQGSAICLLVRQTELMLSSQFWASLGILGQVWIGEFWDSVSLGLKKKLITCYHDIKTSLQGQANLSVKTHRDRILTWWIKWMWVFRL